jgi:hypothetical protein
VGHVQAEAGPPHIDPCSPSAIILTLWGACGAAAMGCHLDSKCWPYSYHTIEYNHSGVANVGICISTHEGTHRHCGALVRPRKRSGCCMCLAGSCRVPAVRIRSCSSLVPIIPPYLIHLTVQVCVPVNLLAACFSRGWLDQWADVEAASRLHVCQSTGWLLLAHAACLTCQRGSEQS